MKTVISMSATESFSTKVVDSMEDKVKAIRKVFADAGLKFGPTKYFQKPGDRAQTIGISKAHVGETTVMLKIDNKKTIKLQVFKTSGSSIGTAANTIAATTAKPEVLLAKVMKLIPKSSKTKGTEVKALRAELAAIEKQIGLPLLKQRDALKAKLAKL